MQSLHIRKGDEVVVLSGKDRGKTGRVVRTWPKTRKVMIEGVNQVKRHEPLRQRVVEAAPPAEFFSAPKTDRAKLFLSQVLGH